MEEETIKLSEIKKIVIGEGEALCILQSAVKNYGFLEELAGHLGSKIFLVDNFDCFRVISNKNLKV